MADEGTYAKIIADSIGPTKDRVTSFELRFHRFVLAELNTHCLFERNSASSRAIPAEKQLDRYRSETAYPVSWPAEQKGMQGGAELEGDDLKCARDLFATTRDMTHSIVKGYLDGIRGHYAKDWKEHTLHKSLINRLLEPMQWHVALVTSASFENFFDLRVSPEAQPELRKVAEMMQELYRNSTPKRLKVGEWHTPYIYEHEASDLLGGEPTVFPGSFDTREISAARCARTSYMTQDGRRDPSEDKRLYDSLVSSGHWSPLGHICTPWMSNVHWPPIIDPDTHKTLSNRRVARLGKFPGWLQWRHVVEARAEVNTYR